MREKDSFFCSTCHNSFARLPLNWSLSEMLMLRESGSLRLATPPPFPPSRAPRWPDNGRQPMPLGVPTRNRGVMSVRLELTANQIGSNSVTPQSHSPPNRYSVDAMSEDRLAGIK